MVARNVRALGFFIFVALSLRVVRSTDCPSSWSSSPSKHCYKFLEDGGDFASCLRACQDLGGSLACVRSDEDNKFVLDLLMADGDSRGPAFIGYTDVLEEGSWQWVANSCTSSFEKWANPEHGGNKDPVKEDCATMPPWHELDGTDWNDESCSCARGCICEFAAVTQPQYVQNVTYLVDAAEECRSDGGFAFVLVGVTTLLLVVTCYVSLCVCYMCKCCCWKQPVAARDHGPMGGNDGMVVGKPVDTPIQTIGGN